MLTFSVEKQIRSFNAKIFREIENYFNLCIRGRMVKNFMTLSLSEPCLMLCIVRVCLLWWKYSPENLGKHSIIMEYLPPIVLWNGIGD